MIGTIRVVKMVEIYKIRDGPFDVIKMVFMPKEGERKMTLAEKSGLFFHDYCMGPLFVQENYPRVKPALAMMMFQLLYVSDDTPVPLGLSLIHISEPTRPY